MVQSCVRVNWVEPPPEITRRQLPVRVAVVLIKVDWQKTPSSDDFCLAGRSVNVRFIESEFFSRTKLR